MSILRTTIDIHTGGLTDYEAEVRIEYSHYAGCGPTREHPGDDPETEILKIEVKDGDKWVDQNWLHTLLAEDEELLGLCALDWCEDQEVAAEYKADARAEMLAEDRL